MSAVYVLCYTCIPVDHRTYCCHIRKETVELAIIDTPSLPPLQQDGAASAHPEPTQIDPEAARKDSEVIEIGYAPQPSETALSLISASTPASRRKARIQFAALCWVKFLAGWNDGTTGPLLPRIQSVYNVRHLRRHSIALVG